MSKLNYFAGFLALLLLLFSTGALEGGLISWLTGEKSENVSDNPEYKQYIGKKIRISQDSFVVTNRENTKYWLCPPGQGMGFQPRNLEEYYADAAQGKLHPQVKGLVETGAEILIKRVELHTSRKHGYCVLVPYAQVESGDFQGLEVDAMFFMSGTLKLGPEMELEERFGSFVEEEA